MRAIGKLGNKAMAHTHAVASSNKDDVVAWDFVHPARCLSLSRRLLHHGHGAAAQIPRTELHRGDPIYESRSIPRQSRRHSRTGDRPGKDAEERKDTKRAHKLKTGTNLFVPASFKRNLINSDCSDSAPPGASHPLSPLRCWAHSEPWPDSFVFVPPRPRNHASWRGSIPGAAPPRDGDVPNP